MNNVMNIMKNCINSAWLVAALLLTSLLLATTVPQASVWWWLLALLGGVLVYLGIKAEDADNLFSPRELMSLLLVSVGNLFGMAAIFLGPLGGIQFLVFVAGLLAARQACYKGMLPWIQ